VPAEAGTHVRSAAAALILIWRLRLIELAALALLPLLALALTLTLILTTLGALTIGLIASVVSLAPALLALISLVTLVTLSTLVTLRLPTLPLILSLLVIHFDLQASRLTGVMARRLTLCNSNSAFRQLNATSKVRARIAVENDGVIAASRVEGEQPPS
jgi:hypothetical protein